MQEGSNDPTLEALALAHQGEPIVWFRIQNKEKDTLSWAIVVGSQVFRQERMSDSFFIYFSMYSVFNIDWCSSEQVQKVQTDCKNVLLIKSYVQQDKMFTDSIADILTNFL